MEVKVGLFLSIGFASCSNEDTLINDEERLKSYELITVQSAGEKNGQRNVLTQAYRNSRQHYIKTMLS